MSPTTKLLTARVILTVIAVLTIVSPFMADWNVTHIYNPLWPPHAKFHNAQTMAMAVLLGLATLFFAWRRIESTGTTLLAVWIFAALYWVSQTIAFLFPGVAWTDPNLLQAGHTLDEFPLHLKGDVVLFAVMAAVAWLLITANHERRSR